jgi:hypothetical protein
MGERSSFMGAQIRGDEKSRTAAQTPRLPQPHPKNCILIQKIALQVAGTNSHNVILPMDARGQQHRASFVDSGG